MTRAPHRRPQSFPRAVATALLPALVAACLAQPAVLRRPPAPPPVIAIVGATLWDGTGRPPIPDAVTVVRQDRIVCAGGKLECAVPKDARVVNAAGRWLIPGLIDSHVHLLFLNEGNAGEHLPADLHDLLAQGVTAVRDMGTDPAALLARTRSLAGAPRLYTMQLVAGRRFFFDGFRGTATDRGTVYRQPPALTMQRMGWTPILFHTGDNADSVVALAKAAGAVGLKLYAQLDSASVRRLVDAGHRAGMPVWGHAWVQPTSVMEQVLAGHDGVVHAAGLAGELFTPSERDTLVHDGALQAATAEVATVGAAHDPRVLAALDSMARRGTIFEPTLDAVAHSVAQFARRERRVASLQEMYARTAAGFGVEVTRQAVRRGVPISAGSDHVAYGPVGDRASLFGELRLLVDSVGLTPEAALLAATRDAARAVGGPAAAEIGTIEAGRYADLVLLQQDPLQRLGNLESVEWVMLGGKVWRPGQLRSGIAARATTARNR
jgi:imidazolonepropionase-like amidohydrolase